MGVCLSTVLYSCSNDVISVSEETSSNGKTADNNPDVRLVFSSRDDLANVISGLNSGKTLEELSGYEVYSNVATRSSSKFVSLKDDIENKILSQFSNTRSTITDEDGEQLEACVNDSIIADDGFSAVLNPKREIQMNDTIYKYYANGVAYTTSTHVDELDTIDKKVNEIDLSSSNGNTILLTENISFTPINYKQVEIGNEENDEETATRSVTLSGQPLKLANGITINSDDIRDLNYDDKGDGGWLHNAWCDIWGRNIVAYKKFSSKRRMRMNFYEQDYMIYKNIGSKVNMHKKSWGIWWNTKAQEIRHGYSALELIHSFSTETINNMPNNPIDNKPASTYIFKHDYPIMLTRNFPFADQTEILFHVPFTDYNATTKNINDLYYTLLKIGKANLGLANIIEKKHIESIFSTSAKKVYILFGSYEAPAIYNKKDDEMKFYAQWFPYGLILKFGGSNGTNFKGVSFDKCVKTSLGRGSVYAAVKYDGKWRACRILKDQQ